MPDLGSGRDLLDKLGVKLGARVGLVGDFDADFRQRLHARTADIAAGEPVPASDLIFLLAESGAALGLLTPLQAALKPNGALWVVWPKGRPHLKEADIRDAALAAGLVDTKVVSFSASLSALRLVIPVARRPGARGPR